MIGYFKNTAKNCYMELVKFCKK